MEIISTVSLISINETLIVQLISFLLFLIVINRVMFRPLERAIAERDTYVEEVRASIHQFEREIKEITDHIHEQELSIRSQAHDLSKGIEETGAREADEIVSAAREQIKARVNETRMAIDSQVTDALRDVGAESESLAVRIMEKLLNRGTRG